MDLPQITLPCSNYEESVRFYRRAGFRQIVASPPRYARFECESGTTFSLQTVERIPASTGVVAYFEVADVDKAVRDLVERGIVIDRQPEDRRWLWREAYLRDTAGNVLCIYHAGENRRFPPWRMIE